MPAASFKALMTPGKRAVPLSRNADRGSGESRSLDDPWFRNSGGEGIREETLMASTNNAVIVTGAASGIGLAMTMSLIKAGHDVTAADRNAGGLAELEKQAPGLKGSVQTVTADLAQPDSFAHVTGAALIKYGRIDALVNNSGIGQASVRKERKPI